MEGKLAVLKSHLDKIKVTMGNVTSSSDPLSMAQQCRDTLQTYNRIEKVQEELILLKLAREHELSLLMEELNTRQFEYSIEIKALLRKLVEPKSTYRVSKLPHIKIPLFNGDLLA